jgi:excisionase family DNA binding protein
MEEQDYTVIEDTEACCMLRVRLGEIEADPEQVRELEESEVCEALGELARIEARLKLRLSELMRPMPKASGDRLLSVQEAAAKLSCKLDFLYRNSKTLPFTVRNGRRLRFSEQGIEKYIRQRTGN